MALDTTCLAPDPDTRRPGFTPPPGSCDTHCHVLGPASRFPYSEARNYTPPDAPVENLWKLHDALGIERAVVVQASVQGTDNAAVLDAIARSDGRYRGVAVIDDGFSDGDLEALHAGGIRGVRFSFIQHHGIAPDAARIRRAADRIAPLGWHVVLHAGIADVTRNAAALVALPVPVVIDHMAKTPAAAGVDDAGFEALLAVLGEGGFWVKISGADRNSTAAPLFADTAPIAQALIAALPDRILWGTDWPHPNKTADMPNDGDLMDLLALFAPDAALRKRILVDNPARLYGFEK